MGSVKVVVCLSGKRKSGKDYIAGILQNSCQQEGISVEIRRISEPLKEEYARVKGLDFEELLKDSEYKEEHRAQMVRWGESLRKNDPTYFCRLALETCVAPLCIVSDCRRPTDLQFFDDNFGKVLKVRIACSLGVRSERGYSFVEGIDDAETECALDAFAAWDFILRNEDACVSEQLGPLIKCIHSALPPSRAPDDVS